MIQLSIYTRNLRHEDIDNSKTEYGFKTMGKLSAVVHFHDS